MKKIHKIKLYSYNRFIINTLTHTHTHDTHTQMQIEDDLLNMYVE